MSFSNIMDSNSYAGGAVGAVESSLITARTSMLGPAYRLFYRRPVHLVRGSGSHLFDVEGNRYLDAYNNVASVGHCHPHVVDSVMRQLATLNTHTRYLHEGLVDYSRRLLATLPGELDQVMYTCTGSEANDLALRVAAAHTGSTGVIVTAEAYHGNTQAVTAISPSNGGQSVLGAHVRTVSPPDPRHTDPGSFADEIRRAATDLITSGFGVSCLIVDTIFSSDGIWPDPTILAPAANVVREAGGVVIADEVQPGFGRTGEALWGFDRHHIRPDIVTLGKPMGNGHPVAAMVARSDVLASFATTQPYFNTFAGNPVSMAAATAVLDVIEQENLVPHVSKVGAALQDEISRITTDLGNVGDVRGAGLYLGVEIVDEDDPTEPDRARARQIVEAMRDRNVLISVCGRDGNVLKIRPPLVFSMDDVDWFCSVFADVVSLAGGLPGVGHHPDGAG